MKKKFISSIIALAMLVTALPTSFAENASDEENVISETEITESVEETENDEQEEIIQEENLDEDEQSEDIQEDVSENIETFANVSGNDIIRCAEKYLGKAYVRGGNGPNGFDCSGLVCYVYK